MVYRLSLVIITYIRATLEVHDTIDIFGMWNHDIGTYSGPYSTSILQLIGCPAAKRLSKICLHSRP